MELQVPPLLLSAGSTHQVRKKPFHTAAYGYVDNLQDPTVGNAVGTQVND